MSKKSQAEQTPTPRKVVVVLTDDEWRQLRISAVANDTTIQGYLTNIVLADLQANGHWRRDEN